MSCSSSTDWCPVLLVLTGGSADRERFQNCYQIDKISIRELKMKRDILRFHDPLSSMATNFSTFECSAKSLRYIFFCCKINTQIGFILKLQRETATEIN